MSIQELIWIELNEINSKKDELDAFWLSEKLVNLSILYGNLTSHIADMESNYYKLLQMTLEEKSDIKFNRAESICKASDEYLKYRKALAIEKSVVETIRSIKKFIKLREEDQKISSN